MRIILRENVSFALNFYKISLERPLRVSPSSSAWCVIYVVLFIAASCYEYYLHGERTAGMYVIDPDGDGGEAPFSVYCPMSDSQPLWTMVRHNMMNQTTYQDTGILLFDVPVIYDNGVTADQLRQLVLTASMCQYYLHITCFNSHLIDWGWTNYFQVSSNDWTGTSTLCNPGKYLGLKWPYGPKLVKFNKLLNLWSMGLNCPVQKGCHRWDLSVVHVFVGQLLDHLDQKFYMP